MACNIGTSHTPTNQWTNGPLRYSNGTNVEGMDHQSVVQLVRKSGNQVKMIVVSVSDEEARRLEPEPTNTASIGMDYYERRSVPVTVPTSKKMTDEAGKEYVVYNIYVAGREVACRRYREFDALSTNVRVS